MRSFTDYLNYNDRSWRNRVNGCNYVNESTVELPRDADKADLFINISDEEKLKVNPRRYCIAPKPVVKLLASRDITGVQPVEQDEIDEVGDIDEMYALLLSKGVPRPIAKMVAYDLWYERDPDTPVVVDPARYHIEIDDADAFIQNTIDVFEKVLKTTHPMDTWGGILVYTGADWMWPSSMGIY